MNTNELVVFLVAAAAAWIVIEFGVRILLVAARSGSEGGSVSDD